MHIVSTLLSVFFLLGGTLSAQGLNDSLKYRYDLGSNYNDLGPTANHLQALAGATHTFMGSGDARVLNCVEMNGSGGAESGVASNKGWTQTALSVWIYVATPGKGTTTGGWVLHGVEMGFGLSAVCPGSGSQPVYSVFFDGVTVLPTTVTGGQPDGWHHIVAQNDGATTSIYLDGQFQTSASETLVPMASNNLPNAKIYVGQSGSTTTNKFVGKLSGLRIYNRTLTNAEILALSGNGPIPSKRIYVNSLATGSNTGSSWANAYTDFHTALTNASAHDTLWVATGSYLPQADLQGNTSPADVSDKAFLWDKNLHIYGGFAGTETSLSQRPQGQKTNLSGDLVGGVEAKTVMFARHLNSSSLIDGFTFELARNTGYGGGLYCTYDTMLTVQNCEFKDNKAYRGAGLCALNQCHIVVKNSTFHDNFTTNLGDHAGAGVHGVGSNFFFQNCKFYNNTALYGSSVELEGSAGNTSQGLPKTIFANCLFHDNAAGYWGSPAIYGYGVSGGIAIYNSTFADNVTTSVNAAASEAIGMNGGTYQVSNSIFWNRTDGKPQLFDNLGLAGTYTLNNCIVKGGYTGAGSNNSATYPDFADTTANNFRLTGNSVALNAGTADTTGMSQWLGALDLDGNNRFYASTIDLGCYEFQANVATDPTRTAAIRLYPNPAHDLLTIEAAGTISIRDLSGKLLLTAIAAGEITLDVSNLPAGMYLLQMAESETTAFVKE